MDVSDRPTLMAMVGWVSPDGEFVFGRDEALIRDDRRAPAGTWPKLLPLDVAALFAKGGFWVLIDPESEQALAKWEGEQRAMQQESRRRRRWYDQQSNDAA